MALAILGWPVDKLSPEIAREVIEGEEVFASKQVFHWQADIVLTLLNQYLDSR